MADKFEYSFHIDLDKPIQENTVYLICIFAIFGRMYMYCYLDCYLDTKSITIVNNNNNNNKTQHYCLNNMIKSA